MNEAFFYETKLEGVDLRGASVRSAHWAGSSIRASAAHGADPRRAELTQSQLEGLIGDEDTLLPEGTSDAGRGWYVWSCWEAPPEYFDAIVQRFAENSFENPEALRAELLCGPGNLRRKTGTPLPLRRSLSRKASRSPAR